MFIKSLIKKFLGNERGNLVVAGALVAIPMIGVVGAAIDYSQIARYRGTLQQALDASALATAKQLGTGVSSSQLEQFSRDFFFANIDGIPEDEISFTYGANNVLTGNTIELTANVDYPVQFMTLLGVSSVALSATSEVKTGNDTLEVALVLDNSGSMYGSKLTTLKNAANSLVSSLHTQMASSNIPNPIKFSLVPFAGMVNVGAANKTATWMDTQGRSSIHHENLTWDSSVATAQNPGWKDSSGNWLTRFTLFDDITNKSWAGCVEARPYPYHTNDASPTSSNPDTLYVPTFAPDEPNNYSGNREESIAPPSTAIYCTLWYWYPYQSYCRRWSDNYWGYYHPTEGYANRYGGDYNYYGVYVGSGTSGGGVVYGSYISEESYENDYLADDANMPAGLLAKDAESTGTGEDQNKRQNWTWKYRNRSASTPDVGGIPGGPNLGCTTNPITPLTASQATMTTAINAMAAIGSTNIQMGTAWGWRTLSSGAPFTEGRGPSASDNSKIMIIMTDGNNSGYRGDDFDWNKSNYNKSIYSSFGFSKSGRIFDNYDGAVNPSHNGTTFRAAMDEHLVETCTNARAAGIRVYTIAFDVPNGSSVKTMLQNCASTSLKTGAKLYFDAGNNSQLIASFNLIGADISNLRLAR